MKSEASSGFDTVLYLYQGWQCVDEADTSGTVKKLHVHGEGIDEVIRATILEPTGRIDDDTVIHPLRGSDLLRQDRDRDAAASKTLEAVRADRQD